MTVYAIAMFSIGDPGAYERYQARFMGVMENLSAPKNHSVECRRIVRGVARRNRTIFAADRILARDTHRSWQSEKGHIGKAMLSRYAGVLDSPLYYIAGPSVMVSGLRATLNDSGVDDDDIRTEEFPGY
jgi:ferredoxin-NADP reductase